MYLILDLFSRDVVGWEVYEEQTTELASKLIKRTCLAQHHLSYEPLVLHSDNGTPMKGATMLETLYKLGITPSNSRPRVSNDNPYSESLFKTLKYRPNYQPKGFESLEDARTWCKFFVHWYRFEHHHSGIKFLTPAERHTGKSEEILNHRKEVYLQMCILCTVYGILRNELLNIPDFLGILCLRFIKEVGNDTL